MTIEAGAVRAALDQRQLAGELRDRQVVEGAFAVDGGGVRAGCWREVERGFERARARAGAGVVEAQGVVAAGEEDDARAAGRGESRSPRREVRASWARSGDSSESAARRIGVAGLRRGPECGLSGAAGASRRKKRRAPGVSSALWQREEARRALGERRRARRASASAADQAARAAPAARERAAGAWSLGVARGHPASERAAAAAHLVRTRCSARSEAVKSASRFSRGRSAWPRGPARFRRFDERARAEARRRRSPRPGCRSSKRSRGRAPRRGASRCAARGSPCRSDRRGSETARATTPVMARRASRSAAAPSAS